MAETLQVNEIFGPTVQGEGPASGQRAVFLRLMGCNLSCSWCDTAWTWDSSRFLLSSETQHLSAKEIIDQLNELAPDPMLVITGGEPLLQQSQPAWTELLNTVARPIHLETNGTILPGDTLDALDLLVASPKLLNAGHHRGHQQAAMHPGYRDLADDPRVHLKIVVMGPADVRAAVVHAQRFGFPLDRLWVMPEGATREVLDARWPAVASAAASYGCNATHRLHVLAWGDERGR
jgi:7-cyano-7-deazaguanosine (preQ0) biosynthesis protein QueE